MRSPITSRNFTRRPNHAQTRAGAAALADIAETNHQVLTDVASGIFPAERVSRSARPMAPGPGGGDFDYRGPAEAGKVRRCHGDLHLRNICLVDGQPTLFDCLEFSDALASIDILYDLAFLLMDLEHRGLAPISPIGC